MTKQERQYLRALFHHYDDIQIKGTSTPDYPQLVRQWKHFLAMMQGVFLVLSIDGDEDDFIINELNELFEQHGINKKVK